MTGNVVPAARGEVSAGVIDVLRRPPKRPPGMPVRAARQAAGCPAGCTYSPPRPCVTPRNRDAILDRVVLKPASGLSSSAAMMRPG